MGREARAIAAAQEAGLAVPEVLLSSNEPACSARPGSS